MLYVVLHLFLTRNFIGLAISALSQDVDAARLAGLRAHRLQLLAFALSGVIIGLAGYAVAPMLVITPDTGIKYLMGGFISAVIGGIGSNIGALLGGPIVGVITMLAIYEFGGELQNVVTVLLLAAVLLVRPQGIFGRRAARRV
jgi:branched-chain amino acid transport system permease protein